MKALEEGGGRPYRPGQSARRSGPYAGAITCECGYQARGPNDDELLASIMSHIQSKNVKVLWLGSASLNRLASGASFFCRAGRSASLGWPLNSIFQVLPTFSALKMSSRTGGP